MNRFKEPLLIIGLAVLLMMLLPLIGKIIIFGVVVLLAYALYIYFKSRSLKKEIERDPSQYFSQQFQQREKEMAYREDAIDAEYTEREIKEESHD